MPESERELWKLDYYHGLLPREDTVMLLKTTGDFLVRKSEENAGDKRSHVLSVLSKQGHKHYIFREEKGLLAVDLKHEKGYKTIKEFIDAHRRKKDSVCKVPNDVLLANAIGRRPWELSHTSIESGAKLGSGAFGIVRRGVFKTTDGTSNKVAIKEATLTKCTKEQIKEFMNEARIMRKFTHLNVIKFYGVAVGDEPLMIVMELATEGALKDYLKEHDRSMRSKLYMVMGAASGMNHIHTKNVIHCDIAARNCLYSDHKVKIADFGLARELQKDEKNINLDKNQRLPIKWLAPETMKDRICSKKTDVWAFGILSWEIFEDGNPPYAHIKNNNDVAKKVIGGERLKFNIKVPKEVAEFITKRVWDGNVAERYTMQKILDWLEPNIPKLCDDSSKDTKAGEKSIKKDNKTAKDKK